MRSVWTPLLSIAFLVGSGSMPSYAQRVLDKEVDWQVSDLHVEGSVEFDETGERFTAYGNGAFGVRIEAELGAEGDEGFFVYTDRSGSWTLEALLFPWWGPSALMIREHPEDPASNFYSVAFGGVVGESVNALFRTRPGAGGNVSIQLFDADGVPIHDEGEGLWFRVTRVAEAHIFFSEFSPDGVTWHIADNRVIEWPSPDAGYGVAVGGPGQDLGEVEVQNVRFVAPPPVGMRTLSQQSFRAGDVIDVGIRIFVSGEDRSTATAEEAPPDGWTISDISHGGEVSDGVIRWNLTDLPVGETVLTYKATVPVIPNDFATWTGSLRESVDFVGVRILPHLDITGGDRVTDGLITLYTFNEGSGFVVHDVSEVGEPMNLDIRTPETVRWGNGYLETIGVNFIDTEGPATKIIDACKETDELTVEGWIKTSDITQNGPARIITCSVDAFNRNFTLGQGWFGNFGDRFEMRVRTDVHNEFQTRSDRGTLTEALTHVVFTRNNAFAAVGYVNNRLLEWTGGPVIEGSFAAWNDSYKFAIGNEIAVDRSWRGEFHLVAIYNRALTDEEVSQNYNAGPFVGDTTNVEEWPLY